MSGITSVGPSEQGMDIFKEFLKTITCNNSSLEDYLQMLCGMFAIGKVFSENIIIAYGNGRNGKSTFFNLLGKVLNDYSDNISSDILIKKHSGNKNNAYAEMRGKRLVISSELECGETLDTATVKKLCSTDKIFAEKKYKDPFSFTPSHTLVLHTNYLPAVTAYDEGTWRRLLVVPFNAVIAENSDIKNYADYLFEKSGGAVLSWIIEGAKKYIDLEYKIPIPEVVKEEIQRYKEDNDHLSEFINSECQKNANYKIKSSVLYKAYDEYCKENSLEKLKQSKFNEFIDKLGYRYTRRNNARYFLGLALKTTEFTIPKVDISKVTGSDTQKQNFYDIQKSNEEDNDPDVDF